MSDAYSMSPRRARVLRAAALLFLLLGTAELAGLAVGFVVPATSYACDANGCAERAELVELAPEGERAGLRSSPTARAAFARHVARPLVRTGLATATAIERAPFALLLIAVGLALRQLAARAGQDLARALPWLRRAALAALLMAVAKPVADSLEAMTLYPGTPAGARWRIVLDLGPLGADLLLAFAALAVAWALDAGSRAERDVAAFV